MLRMLADAQRGRAAGRRGLAIKLKWRGCDTDFFAAVIIDAGKRTALDELRVENDFMRRQHGHGGNARRSKGVGGFAGG